MVVVHHQLKTYDLKANQGQPWIRLIYFTTLIYRQIPRQHNVNCNHWNTISILMLNTLRQRAIIFSLSLFLSFFLSSFLLARLFRKSRTEERERGRTSEREREGGRKRPAFRIFFTLAQMLNIPFLTVIITSSVYTSSFSFVEEAKTAEKNWDGKEPIQSNTQKKDAHATRMYKSANKPTGDREEKTPWRKRRREARKRLLFRHLRLHWYSSEDGFFS